MNFTLVPISLSYIYFIGGHYIFLMTITDSWFTKDGKDGLCLLHPLNISVKNTSAVGCVEQEESVLTRAEVISLSVHTPLLTPAIVDLALVNIYRKQHTLNHDTQWSF